MSRPVFDRTDFPNQRKSAFDRLVSIYSWKISVKLLIFVMLFHEIAFCARSFRTACWVSVRPMSALT